MQQVKVTPPLFIFWKEENYVVHGGPGVVVYHVALVGPDAGEDSGILKMADT